jgi:hypothetical protein
MIKPKEVSLLFHTHFLVWAVKWEKDKSNAKRRGRKVVVQRN